MLSFYELTTIQGKLKYPSRELYVFWNVLFCFQGITILSGITTLICQRGKRLAVSIVRSSAIVCKKQNQRNDDTGVRRDLEHLIIPKQSPSIHRKRQLVPISGCQAPSRS